MGPGSGWARAHLPFATVGSRQARRARVRLTHVARVEVAEEVDGEYARETRERRGPWWTRYDADALYSELVRERS